MIVYRIAWIITLALCLWCIVDLAGCASRGQLDAEKRLDEKDLAP